MTHKKRTLVSFDFAIKHLLRNKKDFVILEGFISTCTGSPLKIESILESESNTEHEDLKIARIDIVAKTSAGEIITIEVQYAKEKHFHQRTLFGVSRAIVDNISGGSKYKSVPKVIVINIAYFTVFENDIHYFHKGKTSFFALGHDDINQTVKQSSIELADNVNQDDFPEYYYLEVKKFRKENVQIISHIEQWTYFLKTSTIFDWFDAPGIQEASRRLDILKLTKKERTMWNQHDIDLERQKDIFETAKEDGWAEGLEAGKAAGKAEGKAEGVTLGILQVAKRMIRRGDKLDSIAELTNLSLEKIVALKTEIDNEN